MIQFAGQPQHRRMGSDMIIILGSMIVFICGFVAGFSFCKVQEETLTEKEEHEQD